MDYNRAKSLLHYVTFMILGQKPPWTKTPRANNPWRTNTPGQKTPAD